MEGAISRLAKEILLRGKQRRKLPMAHGQMKVYKKKRVRLKGHRRLAVILCILIGVLVHVQWQDWSTCDYYSRRCIRSFTANLLDACIRRARWDLNRLEKHKLWGWNWLWFPFNFINTWTFYSVHTVPSIQKIRYTRIFLHLLHKCNGASRSRVRVRRDMLVISIY